MGVETRGVDVVSNRKFQNTRGRAHVIHSGDIPDTQEPMGGRKQGFEPKSSQPSFAFPDITVARYFKVRNGGAEWRGFAENLDRNCRAMGVRALELSQMRLELIPADMINRSLTDRFRKEARDDKPHQRDKIAKEVRGTLNQTVSDLSKKQYEATLALTHHEQFDLQARACDRLMFPEGVKSAVELSEVELNARGERLWQSHDGEFDSFQATGPRSYGMVLSDEPEVYRFEAMHLAGELCKEFRLSSSHFTGLASRVPEITMVESSRDLSRIGRIAIPECPMDIPLRSPYATME